MNNVRMFMYDDNVSFIGRPYIMLLILYYNYFGYQTICRTIIAYHVIVRVNVQHRCLLAQLLRKP